MKKLLLGMGMLMAQQAAAQCSITTLGLDSTTQHTLLRGLTLDGTGMTVVLKPYLPGSLRSRTIIVSHADVNGTPIWQKRITHTNPQFDLQPQGLANGLDGAVVVYGDITHGPWNFWGRSQYINQFAIKVDSSGTVEWARIYMLPDSITPSLWDNGCRSEQRNGMAILGNGTCVWAIERYERTVRVSLDPLGIPISSKTFQAIADTTDDRKALRSLVGPDGSLYGAHFAYNYGPPDDVVYLDVFKVDPSGTVAWSTRIEDYIYTNNLFYASMGWLNNPKGSSMAVAANGDLLIAGCDDFTGGSDHLMRIDATGQLEWMSVPPSNYNATRSITELPNGQLLHISSNKLIKSSATGSGPLQVWQQALAPQQIWAEPGTLAIALGTPTNAPFAKVALTQSANNLSSSCELNTSSNGPSVVYTSPTYSLVIEADTTIIKSWPMSLADSSGMALDVLAVCSMGWLTPGFNTTILGSAVNNSGTASGPITITCTLPLELIPLTYQPAPASITGNVVTWNVAQGLPPDGYWSFSIVAQTPPDPGLLGMVLSTTVTATQPDPEITLTNNTATATRTVVGSYDPNNKLARTSSGLNDAVFFQGTDEWIDYTINFQNTGTAPAIDVVLVDTLPSLLRVGSLLVMGATHPFRYELSASGVLRFIFDNINLPDSNANEPASHGAVHFRIKPEPGLTPGTLIANRADIFFDFNPAVRTPDSEVWIDFITGVAQHADQPLQLFPIPVKDVLTLVLPTNVQPTSLVIRSIDGRTVLEQNVGSAIGSIRIPVGDLKPQVYMLTVNAADGRRQTARFVKE